MSLLSRPAYWLGVSAFVLAGCGFDASGASPAEDFGDSGAALDSAVDGFTPDVETIDTRRDDSTVDSSVDTRPPDDTAPADTGPDTPADTGPPCTETPSLRYGGHCYFLVASVQGWDAAKSGCAAASAHLATFEATGELAAVGGLCLADQCWVDLVAAKATTNPADFHWDDGETGFDGAWCVGEPSGDGTGSAACARLLGGACYADANCATKYFYLCERE